MSTAEILEQIRRLPESEQHELAEQIWMEFGGAEEKLTAAQIAELERRAEEFRRDPTDGISWEQLRDETRIRFGRK